MPQHLELMRVTLGRFPSVAEPASYASARIWHCRYGSLRELGNLVNLRRLAIASYPDPTFEPLSSLGKLEELQVLHLPHISSLQPLAALTRLRTLSLATLPSWDSVGKVTLVDSLAPLASLPSLENLELFGVVPKSRDVGELFQSKSLKIVKVSKYPEVQEKRIRERFAA